MFSCKKKIKNFYFWRHAVTLQILFLSGISWWWKVEKTFSVLFSGNIAQLINFMGLLIFPSNENVKFSIPTKNIESFSHFLAFLINHLVWRAKKGRFIWLSDDLEPELRDRCSWEKLVTVANFKKHPRQKYGSAQRFFLMVFRDEMIDYIGELRLVL